MNATAAVGMMATLIPLENPHAPSVLIIYLQVYVIESFYLPGSPRSAIILD